MQRANDIMFGYGARLQGAGKNMTPDGLGKLIAGYPSHGFVIDRKEARAIFGKVHEPTGELLTLCNRLAETNHNKINAPQASVTRQKFCIHTKESVNDSGTPQGTDLSGAGNSEPKSGRDGRVSAPRTRKLSQPANSAS
jgi:hypothetical protein